MSKLLKLSISWWLCKIKLLKLSVSWWPRQPPIIISPMRPSPLTNDRFRRLPFLVGSLRTHIKNSPEPSFSPGKAPTATLHQTCTPDPSPASSTWSCSDSTACYLLYKGTQEGKVVNEEFLPHPKQGFVSNHLCPTFCLVGRGCRIPFAMCST